MNVNFELDKKINKILSKYKNGINDKIINLVLNGGGIKGIGHLGAIQYMIEKKLLGNLQTIAGSSIGGIIGAFYIAGYTPEELITFMNLLDISKIISLKPTNMLDLFGLDDGERLEFILTKLLEAKKFNGNITLKEFYQITKIKLIMTTVCLNSSDIVYLSYITHPDLCLVTALRMTSALPLIFSPVKYKNKLYIDGGCMDNYPIRLFCEELNNTIGVHVRARITERKQIENVEDYSFSLLQCLIEGVNCNLTKGYEKYTIDILLPDIAMTTPGISSDIKNSMYYDGYNATKMYFEKKENINVI